MRTVRDVCWRKDEITQYCLISIQLSSLALELWALHSISLLECVKLWQVLMILPLSGTAVLDDDIQGFFSWALTDHSLPLEPFLVTHLLHFCQLVMTILMVITELISLQSPLSQTLDFYEKYRFDKAKHLLHFQMKRCTNLNHNSYAQACFLINKAVLT